MFAFLLQCYGRSICKSGLFFSCGPIYYLIKKVNIFKWSHFFFFGISVLPNSLWQNYILSYLHYITLLSWPLCCGHDGVNYLHDAMQGRVGSDGHVSATEVVIYGTNQPHNVQVAVLLGQSVGDASWEVTHTHTDAYSKSLDVQMYTCIKNTVYLSLQAPTTNCSTRHGRCWPRSSCRRHHTHRGWWCPSVPGWRQLPVYPHELWKPCIWHCQL